MVRYVLLLCLCSATTLCVAAEAINQLPQPDYERQPSDPVWLAAVVQFHGHLGPSVIAGARMGMAGLRAVEAKGYFDVEVTCEGPFAQPPGYERHAEGEDHKDSGHNIRETLRKALAGPGAKHRVRTRAHAERAGEADTLALLQEHHDNEPDTTRNI